MSVLKFYKNPLSQQKINDRVITPSSIPIFVLPPTLESWKKASQTELLTANGEIIKSNNASTTSLSNNEIGDSVQNKENRKTLTSGNLPFAILNSSSEKRSRFTKSLINALNLNQDLNSNKNYCEYWLEHGQRRPSPANSLRESTKQDSNFLTTNYDLGNNKNLSVKSRTSRGNYAKSLVEASSQNSVFSKHSSSEKVNILPKSRSKSEALITIPHGMLSVKASSDASQIKHDRSPSRKSFNRTDSWHSSRKFSIKNLFSVNANMNNNDSGRLDGSMKNSSKNGQMSSNSIDSITTESDEHDSIKILNEFNAARFNNNACNNSNGISNSKENNTENLKENLKSDMLNKKKNIFRSIISHATIFKRRQKPTHDLESSDTNFSVLEAQSCTSAVQNKRNRVLTRQNSFMSNLSFRRKIKRTKDTHFGFIDVYVDVDSGKKQLCVTLKNLRFEPLVEVNYLKVIVSYLLIDRKESASNSQASASLNQASMSHRATVFKAKRAKFDANCRNTVNTIKFSLKDFLRSSKKDYLLQCIQMTFEIHSYLPIARKHLSSTFRKQKRVYKGLLTLNDVDTSTTELQCFSNEKFLVNEI